MSDNIREARVRAAMRSGMPELAAQKLADRLEAPDRLREAADIFNELIDWFGAADWDGPNLPYELGKRIDVWLASVSTPARGDEP